MSAGELPAHGRAIAERIGEFAEALLRTPPPPSVRRVAGRQLLDIVGLCVAARGEPYIMSTLRATQDGGACTVFGHAPTRSATDAALINGTAAHGEDFDDTFEGTPVHAGAVVVPAVLAVCEQEGRSGRQALVGIAAGVELMCRMAVVTPTAIHRAGFHPTAVIGAMGSALGAGAAMGLGAPALASALGIAGSIASGIIEYLAEGTWTKRLHAGWAAQSGIQAARLAREGFTGPRTVFEGRHGFFHAFTNADVEPDLPRLVEGLGERWQLLGVAFKPYPCGTMAQPFIDCALAARDAGIRDDQVVSIECDVGEGTVHRLWEPLAEKQRVSNAYAGKFSVPFAIAVSLVDGAAGLAQFADQRTGDERVRTLARKISYRIDPDDEYPANYTGHLKVTLRDGSTREFRQPHLRGGRREPLGDHELMRKFDANLRFGGWTDERTTQARHQLATLLDEDGPVRLAGLGS